MTSFQKNPPFSGPRPAANGVDLHSVLGSDPTGVALLRRRIDSIESIARDFIDRGIPSPILTMEDRKIAAVGLGSSFGHAQYLAYLVNAFTDRTCLALKPSEFSTKLPGFSNIPIMLFSQGLSHNTHGIARHMIESHKGILFTGVTPRADAKGAILGELRVAGVPVVEIPLSDEYQVLIRAIGPFCGYLAAYSVVSELAGSRLPKLNWNDLHAAFVDHDESLTRVQKFLSRRHLDSQLKIVCISPTAAFAHNLAEKIKEGVFAPRPEVVDIYEFDHGAFQNACAIGSSILVLSSLDATTQELESIRRLRQSCAAAGLQEPVVVSAPSGMRPELRVLWYEMIFNRWLINMIDIEGIDQVNWPGKGKEGNYHSPE